MGIFVQVFLNCAFAEILVRQVREDCLVSVQVMCV
jgi:hypothetical protein